MSEEQNMTEEKLNQEPEITNQPSETNSMEVLHHPHVEKKSYPPACNSSRFSKNYFAICLLKNAQASKCTSISCG